MSQMNVEEIDKELLPFLSKTSRPDVRATAMQSFLGLTGSEDGRTFLASHDKYLAAIINLLNDDQPVIKKDAYLALVNLATEERIATKLVKWENKADLLRHILEYVLKPNSIHADIACSLLSNLSRPEHCAEKIIDVMHLYRPTIGFDKVIIALCKNDYNPDNKLHYLGPFLSNLTQVRRARSMVMQKEGMILQRLLPFISYAESIVRRGGVIGTIRNCCFETAYHEWLIGPEVDILPRLLLPLAGPEEFDEEDMEKLPEDLQYLEPTKQREPDPDLRKMLVETTHKLCATKKCRLYIKEKNTYVILRELHKWETDPVTQAAVEDFVSLLIGDEPEEGMENLEEVEIPEDIEQKLKAVDEARQKEIEKELMQLKVENTKDIKL